MPTIEELKSLTTQVRRDILRMVHCVSSGHPGGFSVVPILWLPFTMVSWTMIQRILLWME